MNKIKGLVSGALVFLPVIALAQESVRNLEDVFFALIKIINNYIVPLILGLAVLLFIWGIFKFIFAAGDDDARKEAKKFMIWGVIGLFIMISVWGLVNILVSSFDFQDTATLPGILGGVDSGIRY
jgi:hypothetical protein